MPKVDIEALLDPKYRVGELFLLIDGDIYAHRAASVTDGRMYSVGSSLFKYKKDSKMHSYAPDFYLNEYNIYIEVKGYWWADDEEKMRILKEEYSNIKLIVVYGKEKLDFLCEDFKNNINSFKFWNW